MKYHNGRIMLTISNNACHKMLTFSPWFASWVIFVFIPPPHLVFPGLSPAGLQQQPNDGARDSRWTNEPRSEPRKAPIQNDQSLLPQTSRTTLTFARQLQQRLSIGIHPQGDDGGGGTDDDVEGDEELDDDGDENWW